MPVDRVKVTCLDTKFTLLIFLVRKFLFVVMMYLGLEKYCSKTQNREGKAVFILHCILWSVIIKGKCTLGKATQVSQTNHLCELTGKVCRAAFHHVFIVSGEDAVQTHCLP